MKKQRIRIRSPLSKPTEYVLLHLGAEYNAGNGTTQSMNALMARYRQNPNKSGLLHSTYFAKVEAQEEVIRRSCGPNTFLHSFYDDVSLVEAGGSQTPEPQYSKNVESTKHPLVQKILEDYHQPDVIIIAGLTQAYPAFKRIIWPLLKPRLTDPVLILGMRNPSANAYREKGITHDMWLKRYEQLELMCAFPVAKTQAFTMGLQKGAFYWNPDTI